MLQQLPPELWHHIFDYLPLGDILALRRTCIFLASVGLDHFGTEVPLVYHRDKFRALTEIAKHPVLSKRMTSLFYMCDRLPAVSLDRWESSWPARVDIHGIPEGSDAHNACLTNFMSYTELCGTHAGAEYQTYQVDCLRELFQGCPNMRELTIACRLGCTRRLNASRTAFMGVMGTPDEGHDWHSAGVHQLLNLAHAAAVTETQLDSLTLAKIGHRLWDPRSCEEVDNVVALVQPLRRLRWFTLAMTEREEDELASVIAANQAIANFRAGRFQELLAVATNLRVLKLHFAPYFINGAQEILSQDFLGAREIYLKDVLGDLTFPHLYELAIGSCGITSAYLEHVILRHKATLRRLTLSHLHVITESLQRFFHNIAGQLPDLRKVTLQGLSSPQPWGPPQRSTAARENSIDNSLVKYEVENFVLNGGVAPNWDNHFTLVGQEWIVAEKEDYMQSGLLEDNILPDDPEMDYPWDEFDELMMLA